MGLYWYCFFLMWTVAYAGVPYYLRDITIEGYKKLWRPYSKTGPTGVEYGDISRGSLLQLMAEFTKHAEERLRPRNMRAHLTAEFANNKYTKPFIYPQFFKGV